MVNTRFAHVSRASLVRDAARSYCDRMTLKARVKAGRLVVDEPTDLPDGTVVELSPLDPGDGSTRTAEPRSIRLSRIRTRTSRLGGCSTQKSSFATFARVEEPTPSLHGHCTRARPARESL